MTHGDSMPIVLRSDNAKRKTLVYPKPRYSVREAMELLGIKRTRFYEHVKSGRLPIVKDGHLSFVLHDDLVSLAETSAPSGVAMS